MKEFGRYMDDKNECIDQLVFKDGECKGFKEIKYHL